MERQPVRLEKTDGVFVCTMQGPKMNAMSAEMLLPLIESLREAVEDEDSRVIVIRGDGGHFCTGADLSIMGEKMDPGLLHEHMQMMSAVVLDLHEGPKPVVTEVDGWAVGGGLSLALCSDITYATERALFLMSFIRISLMPDLGSAYFLAERIGIARAKELALTGRVINAEEAFRIGLVNRVVPHEDISAEVMKLAVKMASRSAKALAVTKRSLNTARRTDLRTMLDLEDGMQPFMVLSPEHRRAVEEFLKKQ